MYKYNQLIQFINHSYCQYRHHYLHSFNVQFGVCGSACQSQIIDIMTAFIPSSSARHINMHPKSMIKHKFIPHALPHHTHHYHPTNISTQLQYSHTTTAFTKLPINRFSYTFQLLFTFILGGLFFSTALSMVTAFFAIGKENIFRGWSLAKVCCNKILIVFCISYEHIS